MKKEKTKNAESLSVILKNNLFILGIAWKEAPFFTFHALIQGSLHEIVVFIEHIYMISFIIDCIQYKRPFWNAALFVILVFIGVTITHTIGNWVAVSVQPKAMERIHKRVRLELYQKAIEIDLDCYDDPNYYNDFVWAMQDVPERTEKVMQSVSKLLGALSGIAVTGGYILSAEIIGIVFALVSFFFTILFSSQLIKLQFELEKKRKALERKRDYINRVFYLSEYAKELRLGDVKSMLMKEFDDTNKRLMEEIDKGSKKMPLYSFLLDYFCNSFLFDGLYIMYLLYQAVVVHAYSYGTMVALFRTSTSLKECMEGLAKVFPEFQQHSLYIEKIKVFLNYEIKMKAPEYPEHIPKGTQALSLRNVTFSYPFQKEPVLKNIQFTIKPGEKVALVGYNGAGKTTLIKLLMRLYDVTEGEICYGDKNITEYELKQYRELFGTVFQDYQLFAASLGENISMEETLDAKRAEEVLKKSGFTERLRSLPAGLDTSLTCEFDEEGTNLSGGEAQKVAISRGLYKDCPIMILDEPSSALDPIAEYNLNNTMLHLSKDKTVIFISHRLSTTRMADRIVMLENGRIVEEGNHETLMRQNGKYAYMFRLQAEKYC